MIILNMCFDRCVCYFSGRSREEGPGELDLTYITERTIGETLQGAGTVLSTRQIANGEFISNLANQILVKIAKTKLSGD